MSNTQSSRFRGVVYGLAVSLPVWLLAGCATYAGEADHGVSAIQFSDIPVPDGMELKTYSHESHSFEVDGFRYGDFEYLGAVRPEVTSQYMVDRMAYHGWTLAGDRTDESGRELSFWRRPYRATCRIWTQDFRTRMKVEVRTLVGEPVGAFAASH